MAHVRVKECAESKGAKSAADLMRMTGIGYTLARDLWDDSEVNIRLDTLYKIADALGVSIHDLLIAKKEEEKES